MKSEEPECRYYYTLNSMYLLQCRMQNEHKFNCRCEQCRLGNLPVLLEGIERSARYEEQQQASTSGREEQQKKIMKCTQCDKTFTHKGDMNKHLRIHSGEKPFSCGICSRDFANTSNLSRHVKVHTGDRPFRCDNCGKDFSRKDKLELHKNTKLCKKRGTSAGK